MIVTASDSRNIQLVADLLETKMVVSVLRHADPLTFVKAVEDMQKDGFKGLTVSNVAASCGHISNVVGRVVDQMVDKSMLVPLDPSPMPQTIQ
jgi:hypothetical protein